MYATVEDLAERIPWSELAEAAARDDPEVTGETLREYVLSGAGDEPTDETRAPVAVGWSDDRVPLASELTAYAESGVVMIPPGTGAQYLLVWRQGDDDPAEIAGAGLVRNTFGGTAPLRYDAEDGQVIVSIGTLNTSLLEGEYIGIDCEPIPDASGASAEALQRAAARLKCLLQDAANEMAGYLTGRYGNVDEHPLLTAHVRRTLRTRSVDVAAYRLLGGDTTTERYQVWRRSIEWLVSIASGRSDLFAPEPDVDARFESRASAFSRDVTAVL